MSTQGHESEAINVSGLKASLKKGGNIGIYNEAICSTAGGTAAKVTNTTPPSFSLVAGAKILVKFTYAISAENATLQVGSNTAKPIYYKGSALPADLVKAGTSLLLSYDGTSYNIVGDLNTDTTYSTMGASGSTHASGLVPDTPSVAGTTKFLREDGTWQEPAGQNYSAGSGIDITNGEISVDSTVIYTKTQVDGQFMVIVNSNSEPTSSTLTYTATDGTTKSFKVGDEIRVPDAEADNGYTFYKLYALTTDGGVTTATWDKLGAGGSVNPNETVNISLTQVGGSPADLIGAAITITDDDTSEIILTATWNGNNILTSIPDGTNYTVQATFESQTSTQSNTAIGGNIRNVELQLTLIGVFIEATDGTLYTSSTWASSGKTANAVVVIADVCKVRMALTETALPIHSNYNDPLDNYITVKDEASAKVDYDGEGNTNKIIQFNTTYGTNTASYVAPYCKAFSFIYPSGQKGCLPSFGQLWTLYQNKTEVDACLAACNGTAFSDGYFWSSTFSRVADNGSRYCWALRWSDGYVNGQYLTLTDKVRPVSAYE